MGTLRLSDDQMCFGCGSKNTKGLQLAFTWDRTRRHLATCWTPTKEFQGYAEIVHGGVIALILDELMVNLLWKTSRPAVTAEMSVRFLRPAKVGLPIAFEAHVKQATGRLVEMASVAKTPAGQVVARATAKCIVI